MHGSDSSHIASHLALGPNLMDKNWTGYAMLTWVKKLSVISLFNCGLRQNPFWSEVCSYNWFQATTTKTVPSNIRYVYVYVRYVYVTSCSSSWQCIEIIDSIYNDWNIQCFMVGICRRLKKTHNRNQDNNVHGNRLQHCVPLLLTIWPWNQQYLASPISAHLPLQCQFH